MTVSDLPVGSAPAPLAVPYFPTTAHAVIWRNWGLVPLDRIADVLGTDRATVAATGHAMGLAGPDKVTRDQESRIHLTVIRRNWHLLPYDQLLKLLGWTPERLAYTLREDDFLYIKLGSLKPACPPVRLAPRDPATREREKAIAAEIRSALGARVGVSMVRPFAFVKDLAANAPAASAVSKSAPTLTPCYCYSYFGLYGDPLADGAADPYPNGYLARLRASGVDGVWLQGVLYKLTPFPWDPSLSEGYQSRLRNLAKLVKRLRAGGISLYLYMNEPRAMPLAWFAAHPGLQGVTEGDHAALCTSVPEVRQWLKSSVAQLFKAVPDLGGIFTISASENLTTCWSHYGGAQCPRCSKRPGAEVVADLNAALAEGIAEAGARGRMIAWDWGWKDEWMEPGLKALPANVSHMSVSEWDMPINRGGVPSVIGEYSVSAVGPGPRASRNWRIARETGHKVLAKVQAACSWEMSAVPYVPAMFTIARHAEGVRKAGVTGVMLGWTLGGYPSPNLDIFTRVAAGASPGDAIADVAQERFGGQADTVVEAWRVASKAMDEYPFHIGTVYTGPQQAAPANPLWLQPTHYSATMVGFPYDDLNTWRTVYPAPIFISQFRKVAEGFASASAMLKQAVGLADPARREALEGEARVMETCAIHFRGVANQSEFVMLRDGQPTPAARATMARLVADEKDLACRMWGLQQLDSRLGFEASNQYYYVGNDLAEKVLDCNLLLREMRQ